MAGARHCRYDGHRDSLFNVISLVELLVMNIKTELATEFAPAIWLVAVEHAIKALCAPLHC